ncbi:interleukin-20 receptor subunit [Lynx pardinus]|uniref:Interleukin-20 receptor subunit alpha n=1 Tax=Lynx pardinus TaxID=191816 RepID=A0A485MHK1_LYNPA|nr:interleukin-20 receptor subunit [Lynx pardinus]
MWARRPPARAAARGVQAPGRAALRLLLPPLLLFAAAPSGCAVPCVSSGLPKPTNITFFSINMRNILQWSPPEGLQEAELTYTVQYFIYGQKKWLNKSECRNINRTCCDLSVETSDYEHQYYAKVKAIWETNCSKWAETGRFYPFLETQIGPPEVALSTDEKSISIVLTAPEKWKRNPEESSISMQQIYSNLKYNVSVYNAKSNRTWSQCVTNRTLVLSWLEPDTLYCVRVETFVPGPPRLAQPSEKQCVRTQKDQTSALKVKIIFWYVLPISVAVFILSVMGYSMYRYIHVGKEKHPANLDSKMSHKDMRHVVEKSDDGSDGDEPGGDQRPHQAEMEVKHLGYASHLVDISCDSGESTQGTSLTQQGSPGRAIPTEKAVVEYEYDVRAADVCVGPGGPELSLQEKVSLQGTFFDQQAALADVSPQAPLYSCAPQLRHLDQLLQEHVGTEEEREEEPSTTLVDWDPRTGRLCIPSFPSFDHGSEGGKQPESKELVEEGLLSRLYEGQAPDKPSEDNETDLLKFMEEWGLYVQMED